MSDRSYCVTSLGSHPESRRRGDTQPAAQADDERG